MLFDFSQAFKLSQGYDRKLMIFWRKWEFEDYDVTMTSQKGQFSHKIWIDEIYKSQRVNWYLTRLYSDMVWNFALLPMVPPLWRHRGKCPYEVGVGLRLKSIRGRCSHHISNKKAYIRDFWVRALFFQTKVGGAVLNINNTPFNNLSLVWMDQCIDKV